MPGSWMSTEYALKINEKRFVGLVSIIFSECYILYEYILSIQML